MRQDQIALLDALRLGGQAEAAGLIDHLFARVEGLELAMRRQQTTIDELVEHGRVRDEASTPEAAARKLESAARLVAASGGAAFAFAPSEPRD